MKKVLQILAATVVSVGFMGSVASAEDCVGEVNNSGDNNETVIECETTHNVNIVCVNGVYQATYVVQEGQSGNGTVVGNESTGSVATGTVANYNNNEVEIGITGCGDEEEDEETPVTPPAPVTPTSTPTPGKGAAAPVPTVLPYTAGDSTLAVSLIVAAFAAAVFAVSRFAVAAYRNIATK